MLSADFLMAVAVLIFQDHILEKEIYFFLFLKYLNINKYPLNA